MKIKRNTIILIVLIYMTFNLIFFAKDIKVEILSSLSLWCTVLIPSLFPYLIISQMLSIIIGDNIFTKFFKKIFSINSKSAGIYICSLFCGYPSGAINTYNLYKNKIIKKDEAQRLIYFTNNCAPLFLISIVGGQMLKNPFDGFMIYVIITLSSFIIGVLNRQKKAPREDNYTKVNLNMDFSKICSNSINTLFNICAYVVIGAVIGKIITLNISMFFTKADESLFKKIIYPLIEMTNAIKALSEITSYSLKFCLICACASFGGLSVILQIMSACNYEFSFMKILFSKFITAIISFILAFVYKNINNVFYININCHNLMQFSCILTLIVFSIYIIIKILSKNKKRKIPV